MQSDEGAPARAGEPGPARGDVGDPLIGRLLDGRYRIGTRIARGGMASVYEATDVRLDRMVAVKVMHPGLGDDAEFAARFVREARAAARISHPNVVAVYDQGNDQGVVFLAMEYVRGRTLRDLIRSDAPVPAARALALFEPILAALAAAHREGLIHRDVKPENVLIANDGRIKVADFGLAKAVSADTQHTATGGVLIGTVSYLAPELVVEGRADPRADVYAAGVVLYELLTGVKPHEGESPIQVAYKHVHADVPPPSESVPGLPAYLDALVARATARDRTLRPADAGVFLYQLRRVAQALADGVVDDPELTADLALPPAVVSAEAALGEEDFEDPVVAQQLDDGLEDEGPEPVWVEEATVAEDDEGAALGALGVAAGLAGAATLVATADTDFATESDGTVDDEEAVEYAASATDEGAAEDAAGTGEEAGDWDEDWLAFSDEPDTDHEPTTAVETTAERVVEPVAAATAWSYTAADHGHTAPIGRPPLPPPPGGTDDEPPRPRRSRRGPVLLVLALLLAMLVGVGAWWFGWGRYTTAPGVIGLSSAEAVDKIEAAGLVADTSEEAYSETVDAGDVISADPDGGTRILDGGTVSLVISLGKERYDVPDLAGLTEDKAQDKISKAHLTFGSSTGKWSEKVREGRVISSTPEAGKTVKPGTVVDLVISKGRRPIHVTNWTGKSAEEATKALKAKGLKVDASQEDYSDTVAAGNVISQTPSSGTLYKGDTVTLVVSRGPELVEVPGDGVIAAGVDDARATLESLGFVVKVRNDPTYLGLGYVLRTDPEPGTMAPKGSTVTLYLI